MYKNSYCLGIWWVLWSLDYVIKWSLCSLYIFTRMGKRTQSNTLFHQTIIESMLPKQTAANSFVSDYCIYNQSLCDPQSVSECNVAHFTIYPQTWEHFFLSFKIKSNAYSTKYYKVYAKNSTKPYLILRWTPVGTPSANDAEMELFWETFFSAPYSRIAPKVPALGRKKKKNKVHFLSYEEKISNYSILWQ